MKIGEVGLLTNDVPRLAAFYKQLLEIENDSNDETHQFIITEETTLTIYNDGTEKNNQNQNMKRYQLWESKLSKALQNDLGVQLT